MARAASPLAALLAKLGGPLGQRAAALLDPAFFALAPGAAANVVAARNGDDDGSTIAGPLAGEGARARAAAARARAQDDSGSVGPARRSTFRPGRPLVAPKFTDLGTIAPAPHDDENFAGDATIAIVKKDVPVAGILFSAFDAIGGGGNAAGLSPQQVAYVNNAAKHGGDVGVALALVEGRDGTKQVMAADGQYTRVGGTPFGGPGFRNLLAENRRPLDSSDPTDGDPAYSDAMLDGDSI